MLQDMKKVNAVVKAHHELVLWLLGLPGNVSFALVRERGNFCCQHFMQPLYM